jgi:GT2 family glycosyltransferase
MKELSIIIVNYNVKDFLMSCLKSCTQAVSRLDAEILVVDNHSSDGSKDAVNQMFPQVIWIQNEENIGFSKASNLGARFANGKFLLFLNPDTILPENIFEKILPFAEKAEKFGALGVRMTDENGDFRMESKRNIPSLKNTFNKLFITLLNNKKHGDYYNRSLGEFEVGRTEILTGAFFLVSKTVFEQAGGFDERYFMYAEDIDLSVTILKLGFYNYYFGQISVVHFKGKSTQKSLKYYRRFFGAMELFVDKYYKDKFLEYLLLKAGIKFRYCVAVLYDKLRDS